MALTGPPYAPRLYMPALNAGVRLSMPRGPRAWHCVAYAYRPLPGAMPPAWNKRYRVHGSVAAPMDSVYVDAERTRLGA